jgi:putative transposase
VSAVDPETNELRHTQLESATNNVLAQQFLAALREKHDVDDVPRNQRFLVCERDAASLVNVVFLIDDSLTERRLLSTRPRSPCRSHGDRNSAEYIFHEIKRRVSTILNYYSNAEAKTADEWVRKFAFARNQLITMRPPEPA